MTTVANVIHRSNWEQNGKIIEYDLQMSGGNYSALWFNSHPEHFNEIYENVGFRPYVLISLNCNQFDQTRSPLLFTRTWEDVIQHYRARQNCNRTSRIYKCRIVK